MKITINCAVLSCSRSLAHQSQSSIRNMCWRMLSTDTCWKKVTYPSQSHVSGRPRSLPTAPAIMCRQSSASDRARPKKLQRRPIVRVRSAANWSRKSSSTSHTARNSARREPNSTARQAANTSCGTKAKMAQPRAHHHRSHCHRQHLRRHRRTVRAATQTNRGPPSSPWQVMHWLLR